MRIHNGHMLPDFGTLKPIMGPLDGLHDIPKRNLISFPGKAIASLDTGTADTSPFFLSFMKIFDRYVSEMPWNAAISLMPMDRDVVGMAK